MGSLTLFGNLTELKDMLFFLLERRLKMATESAKGVTVEQESRGVTVKRESLEEIQRAIDEATRIKRRIEAIDPYCYGEIIQEMNGFWSYFGHH